MKETRILRDIVVALIFGVMAMQAYAGEAAKLDRWIVVFSENANIPAHAVDRRADALAKEVGAKPVFTYKHAIRGFVVEMSENAATHLRSNPMVATVEKDRPVELSALQNYAPWHLDRLSQQYLPLNGGYSYDYDGYNVPIYIMDTGVDLSHEEFESRAVRVFHIRNVVGSEEYNAPSCNGPRPRPCGDDGEGYIKCPGSSLDHGTSVAAVAGGKKYGVAKKARIKDVKVFNDDENACMSWIVAGIDAVASIESGKSRTAIVNMSISIGANAEEENGDTADSIKSAVNGLPSNVLLVASAGNNSANANSVVPANMARALTVGATDRDDRRAEFSNYGSKVDIFAPGVAIRSTEPEPVDGTSFSAPMVSGMAAIYLHATSRYQTWYNVKNVLINNATVGLIPNPAGSHNRLLHNWYNSDEPVPPKKIPQCPYIDPYGNVHECQ